MQYGSQVTYTATSEGFLARTERKFFDFEQVKEITTYTESVKVKNEKQALAQFLLLLDTHRAGNCTDFSMACVTNHEGELIRVEKTWTVEDLH